MQLHRRTEILIITHDATITGAPILLLNLIELLLKLNAGKYKIRIVIKDGIGSLVNEFEDKAPTLIWRKSIRTGFLNRVIKRFISPYYFSDKKIQQWINESDIVFSNTITNGDFWDAFHIPSSVKIISYIHELEIATGHYTSPKHLDVVLKQTQYFLAPSEAVVTHLINNLQVLPEKILKLQYYIPFELTNQTQENVISKDGLVVGLVGTLDWRKGADILPIIVSTFFKKYPNLNVLFKWQGADVQTNEIEFKRINYELSKLDLANKVEFLPPTKIMSSFYASIDLLLLSSKEDPYPLVVLEAACNSKPCICFDKAGGAPEFVSNDAGFVISYLDINSFCEAIHHYYVNKSLLKHHGKTAFDKYQSLHYNQNLIINQFNSIIKKIDN